MKLYEEYNVRHGIAVPNIGYTNFSVLSESGSKLTALTCMKHGDSDCYTVQLWEPSCDRWQYFRSIDEFSVNWNDYEEWLFDYDLPFWPIMSKSELELGKWQWFLCACDSWLSERNMSDDLYSTVNLDLPLSTRIKNIETISQSLPRNEASCWRSINNFFEDYGYWYGKLTLSRLFL